MRFTLKKNLAFLCLISLCTLSCKKKATYAAERIQVENIPVDENTKADTEISNFIAPYKTAVDSAMSSVLAYSPKSLSKKDSKFNTAIGNMMADAVFEQTNPIFKSRTGYSFNAVLLNYGGIRSTLNKGDVTTRTAYEIMPFENEVVVVELSGFQMKELFNYLSYGTAHPISGLSLTLDKEGKLKEGLIQGEAIVDNETYFIATSDYLQNGGDNMTFLSKPISKLELDYKIRNVLIDYFKSKDTITAVRDNRFIKEK